MCQQHCFTRLPSTSAREAVAGDADAVVRDEDVIDPGDSFAAFLGLMHLAHESTPST